MNTTWLVFGALGVGAALLGGRRALAYVRGTPVHIDVAPLITRAADGSTVVLRADAARAWNLLARAAANDGVAPRPSGRRAAFRTQEDQVELLEELGSYRDDPTGIAAAVGYSPHQAGIALDIDGVDPRKSNYRADLRAWLLEHGPTYGWHPVGSAYRKPEPWHWEFR